MAESRRRFSVEDWSLRTRLLVLLGTVGAFLAVMLVTRLSASTDQTAELDRLIGQLAPATEASGDLRAAVIDQESSVRGHTLTEDEEFVRAFERARDDSAAALDELEAALGPSVAFDDELAEVKGALASWREVSDRLVLGEPGTSGGPEEQEENLRRFDGVVAAIDGLDSDVQEARSDIAADLRRSADLVNTMTVVEVAGILVLSVVILAALNRLVLRPVARLGDDARQVAAGNLDHRVAADGSYELRRLGRDVDAMRRRIVDEIGQVWIAHERLERQAADLRRSNADLEQFAYVASHDLQEPLRKVSGFCQLLQRRYGGQLDERADEYIAYAVDGAKRMQDLINDLLAFSRVGRTTDRFERIDLDEVVRGVLAELEPAIQGARAVVTVGDLPEIHGDRRLVATAFQNLIVNGIKFRSADPPEISITARPDGDDWAITVADNGVGIDPQYGDRIFTIFQRLHGKAEYPGTGIGLALVKKIVEFHGGTIRLVPDGPPGATFALTLPRQKEPPHGP